MHSPSSPVEGSLEGRCLLLHAASGRALVGLAEGGELLTWSRGELPRGGARELSGLVEEVLGDPGADLTAVACFQGPGSFTGIKVGLAFARGYARARGLPLVGLDNLDALAASWGGRGELLAVVDALRGECQARRYLVEEGVPELREDLGRVPWESLPRELPRAVEVLPRDPGEALAEAWVPEPESLLEAGARLLVQGGHGAPRPVWTRPSWAEESVGRGP